MITEYLLKKTLDVSFIAAKDKAKKILSEQKARLLTRRADIEDSLNLHFRSIKNWSEEISFADLKKSKLTSDVFIELDIFVYPRHVRITRAESIGTIRLQDIFDVSSRHVVLLGQPGAGKTTSMKHLCHLLLHDENYQKDRFNFPVLIKLRDLNNESEVSGSSILIDYIFRLLGLKISLPVELQGDDKHAVAERTALREKVVVSFLEEFRTLLILDGFDEVGNVSLREKVLRELEKLAPQLEESTFILTSRTGDFKYVIENTEQYEISPLNREQITKFAVKWLGDNRKASDFIDKVYKTPIADTAIRPLTLAHLCAIYERIQDIPEKPKTVYKKIVNLLLEEWDQQRSVKRDSRYAHFEVDRKYEFLCHLAYQLTSSLNTSVFSTDKLLNAYKAICGGYGLNVREARQVVSELETHNGLFIQSGYDEFEFAHKSLQEFLTAEYLVKLPSIPNKWWTLMYLPNELAIAVAISSDPSMYFAELVLSRFKQRNVPEDFIRPFLNRLVIEKPDFNTTLSLQLALLAASSYYIDTHLLMNRHAQTAASEHTLRDIEQFIKLHYTKTVSSILNCYQLSQIYEMEDNNNIQRLFLDRAAAIKFIRNTFYDADDLNDILEYFPNALLVRNSIFYYKSGSGLQQKKNK